MLDKQLLNEKSAFVIFAVDSEKNTDAMYFMAMNNIAHKIMLGKYKDETEMAFCVPTHQFSELVDAGYVDNQESFLLLGVQNEDGLREGKLLYSEDNLLVDAGVFKPVTKEVALEHTGYTYDPSLGMFFVLEQ